MQVEIARLSVVFMSASLSLEISNRAWTFRMFAMTVLTFSIA